MKKPLSTIPLLLISFPLFAQSLLGEPAPTQTFDQVVEKIKTDGPKDSFDLDAASQKNIQVASTEQLASFLGEESLPLQLAAVRALGEKKEKALLLYLGVLDPAVRSEVAKYILGPPAIPEGIPFLAKSLTFGDQTEGLIDHSIAANVLLADEESAHRLILYAANPRGLLPMREKALAELLQFPALTTNNEKQIAQHLFPAFATSTPEAPLSALWLKRTLTLFENAGIPVPPERLHKLLTDSSQSLPVRMAALDALMKLGEDKEMSNLLMFAQAHDIRPLVLPLWYAQSPDATLAFCREALGAELEFDKFWDSRLIARDQDIIQFLSALATPAADTLLEQSISKLVHTDRLDHGLWLEVEEALTTRGEAIKPGTHAIFKNLLALNSQGPFPEDRFPALVEGGDRARGQEIAFSKKGRCTECHSLNRTSTAPYFSSDSLRATRKNNLRTLIAPNLDIKPGEAITTFELKDGTTLSGPELYSTNPSTYFYQQEDGEPKSIAKKEVASMKRTSPMPPALDYLTPREVRDLVAYLTNADNF